MPFKEVSQKVDFSAQERETLAWWKENQSFEKLQAMQVGREKKWSFIDGPITANNPMGVHHAWGRAYKDLYNRFWAMQGYELRYQQGFDCQGLWVEVEVEKEMGFRTKKDIEAFGLAKFVNKCKERVLQFSAVQTEQSVRLGYWMDWNDTEQLRLLGKKLLEDGEQTITVNGPQGPVTDTVENIVGRLGMPELGGSYYTLSNENNYMIWRALKICHDNDWLYRGADVMPWCPRCATAISQHEIVTDGYMDITHRSVIVKFPLRGRDKEYLLIWTTTPWTLTSNVAAAVGPELDYVKVKVMLTDEIYYLSKGTVKEIREKHYEIIGELKGQEMVGWEYDGPFDELPAAQVQGGWTKLKELITDIDQNAKEAHRIIVWDAVGEEEGTSIVHIAPGAGADDFLLGQENSLPIVAPLNDEGYFVDGFDWLTGMQVSDVADPIFENLKEKGLLYHIEPYTHRYPTCWRCKTELVFRLVDEWFISMEELRPQLALITKRIRWIPGFGLDRELDWLKNMHDWMISKKRYWGLALPIWECESCDHWTVVGDDIELKELAVKGYDEFAGHTPHRPWIDSVKLKCDECGGLMKRIADVGNPWLDAGIVSFSTLRYRQDRPYWNKWYPADLITESFPGQFRNWFYSMLVMGAIIDKSPSFMTNFGYATLFAEDGRPMHKSWGNSIEFNEAANKMGADVMRWMYCNHKPEQNLLFGYKRADETRRQFLLPLWNVYNFLVTYANLDYWTPTGADIRLAIGADSDMDMVARKAEIGAGKLDAWIVARLNEMLEQVTNSFENYDAYTATVAIQRLLEDLTNWYVRRSRRRFWRSEHDSDKEAAYATLYHVLTTLTRTLAPITPFVTEVMYQTLVHEVDDTTPESVHHCSWPQADKTTIDQTLIDEMALARQVASLGLAARSSANIKVRQPLSRVLVYTGGSKSSLSDELTAIVTDELNVKSLEFVTEAGVLVQYRVIPNLKVLGPKLGKLVPMVRKELDAINTGAIQQQISDTVTEFDPQAEFSRLQKWVTGLDPSDALEQMKQSLTDLDPQAEMDKIHDAVSAFDPSTEFAKLYESVKNYGLDELVADIQASEPVTLVIGSEAISFDPEELLLSTDPAEGLAVAADKVITVGIDVVITAELAAEGLARELVRRIQNMRKEANFDISDKITVFYQAGGEIEAVFSSWGDYIKTETLALALELTAQAIPESAYQKSMKIAGSDVTLGVEKV
ncbi:class I tRNA ligase family protein [Anaerolineales bacterium HSG24]|nr:class I tRNA ligase family protein [Anaerolineales bacterium HSG24]